MSCEASKQLSGHSRRARTSARDACWLQISVTMQIPPLPFMANLREATMAKESKEEIALRLVL